MTGQGYGRLIGLGRQRRRRRNCTVRVTLAVGRGRLIGDLFGDVNPKRPIFDRGAEVIWVLSGANSEDQKALYTSTWYLRLV